MQRHQISASIEWPTVLIAVVIHAAWMLVTLAHARLSAPVLFVLGGCITAWHGSLQHEIIHGHPTPWRRVNLAIGASPLSLWLPFANYEQSHLAHHRVEAITDPDHDPESRYLRARPGLAGALQRAVAWLQSSLAGRLVIGPLVDIPVFLWGQLGDIANGRNGARRTWFWHLVAATPLLLWLHFVCRLPLTSYLVCFVYPGASLSMLRAFAEHRADPTPQHRVAVVENAPLLGVLFLNNNLHAAHHRWPAAPWFRLPRLYALHRQRLLEANGGLVYDGYAEVARRFLLRAHDQIDYERAVAREPAA